MATGNPWKQFQSVLGNGTQKVLFRAQVVALDPQQSRAKLERHDGQLWVSNSIGAQLNDKVIADDEQVSKVLTSNDYQKIEV